MAHILILYGTTDGHTAKIAAALTRDLTTAGCHVDARDARRLAGDVRPEDYDGVVVAASLHAGGYQRAVRRWVRRHAAALNERPGAFLSVCLAVLEQRKEVQHELGRIMNRFFDQTGWRPAAHQHVAGALLYTRYGWLKRLVMKRIVTKAGGDTDTTRDFEYTDWKALTAFARDFASRVQAGVCVPAAMRTDPVFPAA